MRYARHLLSENAGCVDIGRPPDRQAIVWNERRQAIEEDGATELLDVSADGGVHAVSGSALCMLFSVLSRRYS